MPSYTIPARRRWSALVLGLTSALIAGGVLAATPTAYAADTVTAVDGFDRTTSSGWGNATTGGSWTVVGGSGSSTGSSVGKVLAVNGGRSTYSTLKSVSATDVTVRAAFVAPSVTNGYYSAEARRQSAGTSYQGRVRIDAARKVHLEVVRNSGGTATILGTVNLSGTAAAGQAVSVELLVTGTSPVVVKAKSYLTGGSVPDWQVAASDASSARIGGAGNVGVYFYNNTGNDATTISTQAFSATTISGGTTAPPVVTPPVTPPVTPTTPTATSAGSAAIGSTSYAVPNGAVFVSPSGSDSAAGTLAAPVKTVTKALTKVSGGGTIVLRGGVYHEYFIVPPGKGVTIQSYPKEAVWFDGSSTVTGFTASGSTYRTPWTTEFDSSPTYTKGKADGTADGWQFVNPSYPMAAHPDAVWIDGVEQTQVASLSQVSAGKFFADYSGNQLYLGTNPAGKTVQASTLSQAVSLRAPGTVIRGIGFRRFADSVWMQGAITTYYTNQTLENVVVQDSATAGIGIYNTGSTLRDVSVIGSGQVGVQASKADNLMLDNLYLNNNNDQLFNAAPSAGGLKVTTTRGVTLKDSTVLNTNGNSVWFDESSYNIDVLNNTIQNGTRYGVVIEISSTVTLANNLITDNTRDGILIQDTDRANVWNNTVIRNGRYALAVLQDQRRITNLGTAGHDPRRTQPDTAMPWVISNTSIGNNIFAGAGGSDPVVNIQDYWKAVAASSMISYSNGNVYSQTAVGTPKYVMAWGYQNAAASYYVKLSDYVQGTGMDKASYSHIGSTPVNSSYQAVSDISSRDSSVGQALPSGVASKIGKSAGTRHIGVWR